MSNDTVTYARWLFRRRLLVYRYQTSDGALRSRWHLKVVR